MNERKCLRIIFKNIRLAILMNYYKVVVNVGKCTHFRQKYIYEIVIVSIDME